MPLLPKEAPGQGAFLGSSGNQIGESRAAEGNKNIKLN
jgi:hypothetical protein